MKRFWNEVAVEPCEGGYRVTLDGRPIRTQGGQPQVVPAAPLAEAMAQEWRAQGEEVDPRAFPLRDLTDYAKRFSVTLIAVSANAESALAKAADISLVLPAAKEACPLGLAPTTSTLMQLAIGDALAVALFESRGFTALQFREFHPGGKLGASLTFVRDLMHQGASMPLVALGTRMSEALVEMTGKGFGCVGVTAADGSLVGIVTDGDLRRHMRDDLLTSPVENVMTKNPRSVRPDQLAAEALEILNSRKVTALFVVENTKPVGLVHVHDLLRIGVA